MSQETLGRRICYCARIWKRQLHILIEFVKNLSRVVSLQHF